MLKTLIRIIAAVLACSLAFEPAMSATPERAKSAGVNCFASQALAADLVEALRPEQKATPSILALGTKMFSGGEPGLILRQFGDKHGYHMERGDSYRQKNALADPYAWFGALRTAFARTLHLDILRVDELFLFHYDFKIYHNERLASFFQPAPTASDRLGTFGFDERLFLFPTILTLLAIPHEVTHALLINENRFLQEMTAMYRDVRRLLHLSNHIRARTEAARTLDKIQTILERGPKAVGKRQSRRRETRQGPIKLFLDELRRLENQNVRASDRTERDDETKVWKGEHSLYSFFSHIAAHAQIYLSDDERLIRHIVSFLVNNRQRYFIDKQILTYFDVTKDISWQPFVDKVRILNRKVEEMVGRDPLKVPRYRGRSAHPRRSALPLGLHFGETDSFIVREAA